MLKTKKAKKKKKAQKRKAHSRMMVIRVSVPWRDAPEMKVCRVYGLGRVGYQELEVLSAYYDMPGQPNARP